MHDIDETGYEKRARAGVVPYMKGEDGVLRYLMMVSSDPQFGGPRPMISKGKIERGEDPLEAAFREANEELGLRVDNVRNGSIVDLAAEQVVLKSGTYFLTLFGCEIIDKWNFDKWTDETEYTVWMSLDSFRKKGRGDHVPFVERLEELVRKT